MNKDFLIRQLRDYADALETGKLTLANFSLEIRMSDEYSKNTDRLVIEMYPEPVEKKC